MEQITAEDRRLNDNATHTVFWKNWGPYLSERQWGTVREDYSEDGEPWDYFPFDHARSRAYRWGEDGLGGISDINQDLCFAVSLWNGKDPILKERLFGVNSREGNHGEDVKELYYYLDNTPTHSYMKYLYKYPQDEFPYGQLIEKNRARTKGEPEYELLDTAIFDRNKYFDVFVEYAKASPDDILIRIEVFNRAEETAGITVLPTLWFRNTWAFGKVTAKPEIKAVTDAGGNAVLEASHEQTGRYFFFCKESTMLLLTENETNTERLFGVPNRSPFVKDAFHEAVITRRYEPCNKKVTGTKGAAVYHFEIPGGGSKTIRLRLTSENRKNSPFDETFDETFRTRQDEADEFYEHRRSAGRRARAPGRAPRRTRAGVSAARSSGT